MELTKLEIDHAERFEKLGLFKNADKSAVVNSKGKPWAEYHWWMAINCQRTKQEWGTWSLVGPLPSCEEIWPVILGRFKGEGIMRMICAFVAIHNAFIKIVTDYTLWEDLVGAMREACLTLFEDKG